MFLAGDNQLDDDDEVQETDAFTSIWDLVPGYTQSPLDAMIDKEDVTLEQVLDEDTLIQELKSANQKVIGFLSQENNLNQLVNYLSKETYQENVPTVEKMSEDQIRTLFKYPFIASEIIGCEVDEINEGLINKERITSLLSYLNDKNPELTPVNASQAQYFIRTVQQLLQKHYKTMSQIITTNVPIDTFIKHIGTCDMDLLLLKLLGFETDNDGFEDGFSAFATHQRIRELFLMKQRGNDQELQDRKNQVRTWALQNNVLDLLAEKLISQDEDVHRNIFGLLAEILEKGKNQLSDRILSEDFIAKIVDIMLHESDSTAYIHGVGFLRTVLDSEEGEEHVTSEAARKAIVSRTDDFIKLLTRDDSSSLGETRLRTVEHLYTLYKLRIEQVWTNLPLMNTLLDLFFSFAFNNMLHCNVFAILQIILESDRDDVKLQIIRDTNLLPRLLQAHESNEQSLLQPKGFRKGYMGFVVELSNMIRKLSINDEQPIGAYAKSVAGWSDYLNGPLNERNALNEKQMGGPIPIGSHFPSNLYQFDDDDDDDDDYAYDDEDDDSEDEDDEDEEVVIRKSPSASGDKNKEQQHGVLHTDTTGAPEDFDADFEAEFV